MMAENSALQLNQEHCSDIELLISDDQMAIALQKSTSFRLWISNSAPSTEEEGGISDDI